MNENNIITVNQLNIYLKKKFEEDINLRIVYLRGEISNFKNHTRGHLYFTLKDDDARISAVMFASSAAKMNFMPEDGTKVIAIGRISVYPATGQYQIYVEEMIEDGKGNLHLEYEKLKNKLEAEGLFDVKHKKKLPPIPKVIGIITAPTGAAIRDILSTIKRRWPLTKTILFPAMVQGEYAEKSLIDNFKKAMEFELDVIIIGRGGGSIEDLWSFNSEALAREIFNSKIPVISAVGHEVDFTICDFVADMRAPTPTGAAEMAVPNQADFYNYLNQIYIRLNKSVHNLVKNKKEVLKVLAESYVLKNPRNIYEALIQKLDTLIMKKDSAFKALIIEHRNNFNNLKNNMSVRMIKFIDLKINYFDKLITKLDALSPLKTMKRGYLIALKDGKVVKSKKDFKRDEEFDIKLHDGDIKAKVL